MALLKGGDRAAVIGFNTGVAVAATLTAGRGGAERGDRRDPTADGTRIDLAARRAAAEALPPAGDPARQRIIVLLTDGRASTTDEAVPPPPAAAKDGRKIFAIGLGDDIDATCCARSRRRVRCTARRRRRRTWRGCTRTSPGRCRARRARCGRRARRDGRRGGGWVRGGRAGRDESPKYSGWGEICSGYRSEV
ncbi:MAG: hypothetical protein U0470_09495 [Anaerolineae bacterium]